METHHRTQAPAPVTPLAPPEADVFLNLWKAEVRRAYAFRRALEKAERFVSGFEGDPLQDGVDELLTEMRAALADDPRSQPARKTGWLADLALFALIPLCLAATAGVIWSHLL